MFVPIDRLLPILSDLMADGRAAGPARPWLGLNTEEAHGRLFVSRVTPESPAEKAGVQRGDIILGVNGATPTSLADFYRKLWAVGSAGVVVPLDLMHGSEKRRIDIKSMNRLDHLKLKSTF
jgi:S1-C subfamily serine protease